MESLVSDGLSISDMVANIANEVFHSKVPEGFEWIEAYNQYYSRSTDYFYDPSTGLFFHNNTQTYYIFNEETYEYEIYKDPRKVNWPKRRYENRAKNLIGREFEWINQEGADICSLLFSVVDKISKVEKEETLHSINQNEEGRIRYLKRLLLKQQSKFKVSNVIHTDDPSFVCFASETNINDNEHVNYSEASDSSDSEFELGSVMDERQQMMEDERFGEAPLIRIIDEQGKLYILTISGGVIGRNTSSEVILEHPAIPERFLEVTFVPECNLFVLKKLTYLRVLLNDYELSYEEDKEIEHADIVSCQGITLSLHVHYGNNTCPGCEPGLLTSTATVNTPQFVRGETARRKTMKMIKSAYGLNNHETSNYSGFDRAAYRRKYVGSEGPAFKKNRGTDPYSGCLAKPISAPTTTGDVRPTSNNTTIGSQNKGFKLLKSMGWKEGEGLGKHNTGRMEPVMNDVKNDKTGLGARSQTNQKPTTNSKREGILDITRRRYEQIDAEKK